MKFKLFTTMLMGLLALSACNDDHDTTSPTPEKGKGFSPKIIASVEQAPLTKAGVVEDNDYTIGENFYWSRYDNTTVVIGEKTKQYYVDSVDSLPNRASFRSSDTIIVEAGTYDITGYFPSYAWSMDTDTTATISAMQAQTNRTSDHLSFSMLMLAQSKNVEVNELDPINLHYKHLASVFRFVVTNISEKNLNLTDISISLKSNLGVDKPVFGIKGSLANNATSLTIDETSKVLSIGLELTDGAQNFTDKSGTKQCEGYMTVLPMAKASFGEDDELVVEFILSDGTKPYKVTKTDVVRDLSGLLGEGIKQGKSYYILQEITNENLKEVSPMP